MPDWIGHILLALIIAEIFNINKKSLLVLGSLLPDFLGKMYLLNYFVMLPIWLTTIPFIFHFLFPAIIAGLLIAFLFRTTKAFILIPIGVVLHLLADYTTKHFFTTAWYAILWEDLYWIYIMIFGIIYLLVLFIKHGGKKDEIKENIGE